MMRPRLRLTGTTRNATRRHPTWIAVGFRHRAAVLALAASAALSPTSCGAAGRKRRSPLLSGRGPGFVPCRRGLARPRGRARGDTALAAAGEIAGRRSTLTRCRAHSHRRHRRGRRRRGHAVVRQRGGAPRGHVRHDGEGGIAPARHHLALGAPGSSLSYRYDPEDEADNDDEKRGADQRRRLRPAARGQRRRHRHLARLLAAGPTRCRGRGDRGAEELGAEQARRRSATRKSSARAPAADVDGLLPPQPRYFHRRWPGDGRAQRYERRLALGHPDVDDLHRRRTTARHPGRRQRPAAVRGAACSRRCRRAESPAGPAATSSPSPPGSRRTGRRAPLPAHPVRRRLRAAAGRELRSRRDRRGASGPRTTRSRSSSAPTALYRAKKPQGPGAQGDGSTA